MRACRGVFWTIGGFADGGRTLIASRINVTGTQSVVWRIDTASGKAEALTDPGAKMFNKASGVSADGKTIALTTQTPDGALQAALFDTQTRKTALAMPDAWEQQSGSLSADGRTMVLTSNVDGRNDLFLARDGAKAVRLDLPPGSNDQAGGDLSLSPDGKRLIVAHEASNTPFDLWTVDLASNHATRITTLGLASVSPANLPPAQLVHYKSQDGTVISAFLWVPYNLKRDRSAPGIVYAHGGPTGQTPDFFSRLVPSARFARLCRDRAQCGAAQRGMDTPSRWRTARISAAAISSTKSMARSPGGDGVCRCEEDRHHRRLLWRLYDHDGARQDARCLGRGRRVVRHHRLVLDVRA